MKTRNETNKPEKNNKNENCIAIKNQSTRKNFIHQNEQLPTNT